MTWDRVDDPLVNKVTNHNASKYRKTRWPPLTESGKVEYIEDAHGGVIKIEPDGTETIVMSPKGGFFETKSPVDPAKNKQLIDEYLAWKASQR